MALPSLALVFPLAVTLLAAGPSAWAKDEASWRVTVYVLWASDQVQKGKLPAEIEKLQAKLKKRSGKTFFRLERQKEARVGAGKDLELKLPGKYGARWTWDAGRKRLVQRLTNPKGRRHEVTLRRSPGMTFLPKIKQGRDSLVLVVLFTKGGNGRAGTETALSPQ